MAASLAAALAIGVISACLGSLYYCKPSYESRDKRCNEQESEQESPFVRIKISHAHREGVSENEACTDIDEHVSNCIDANRKCNREVCELCKKSPEVVPVKPPRKQRRQPCDYSSDHNDRNSKGIWSSAMQNRLENITNSQAESCGTVRMVRAQVEVYPCSSASTNNDTPDQIRQESLPDNPISTERPPTQSSISGSKRHLSVVKKWKHLKNSILPSRFTKSISIKEVEKDEVERLHIPVRASLRQSPVGHSTMLQKKRFVDTSTSTRLSANVLDTNQSEICANDTSARLKSHETCQEAMRSKGNSRHPSKEVLEDVVSLIKRRSVDGKSLCDVRITGLAMNQAELLDLFEATGGKSKSASIVTTKEASIISIKFQRDGCNNNVSKINANLSAESPFRSIYKIIPEKLTDFALAKWFRSDRKSNGEEFIEVPKHLHASPNETSYIQVPNFYPGSSRESPFQRERNLSERLIRTRFDRFVRERRI